MRLLKIFLALWLGLFLSSNSLAIDVNITKGLPYLNVMHEGKLVKIMRIQDQENVLTGGFAKTSRKCPPFCANPMQAAAGVATVGEVEILEFMDTHLKNGTGYVIDARTPEWYQKGTIPGSINIPFYVFGKDETSPEFMNALKKLGVTEKQEEDGLITKAWNTVSGGNQTDSKWDFTNAKELALWCNGPWCGQSPRAIRNLLALGYPAEKLRYYRGGMQLWLIMGLTVVVPGDDTVQQ